MNLFFKRFLGDISLTFFHIADLQFFITGMQLISEDTKRAEIV